MAAPAAGHRRNDPPSDGSARPHARRPGAAARHREPRQRGSARQERLEHDDGAAPARPLPHASRTAASAAAEGAGATHSETSRGVRKNERVVRAERLERSPLAKTRTKIRDGLVIPIWRCVYSLRKRVHRFSLATFGADHNFWPANLNESGITLTAGHFEFADFVEIDL